ncbi:MAG: SDR family oxidoreductase [Hyphomicrobium sp.]|jgi:NAD(P)-dependent dehydrogenase (short-subunit alcohol dehydrogenase family)
MSVQKNALVTGANRGIGLEVARQLARQGVHVVIGARDAAKGEAAAAEFSGTDGKVDSLVLDVADAASTSAALAEFERRFGQIDILVNNAGILIDGPGGFSSSFFDLTDETARKTFETNVIGPARLLRALIPGMKERGYGRIVNVSSITGQLSGMGPGFPAYRMSKVALNALTRTVAAEIGDCNVKINAVCPGWCRTDMGGAEATRPPEKGAETIAWLALLPDDGPTGLFFRDKAQLAW